MLKRLKNLSKIRSYIDWPKVQPGEILVVPSDNRLHEHPPFLNDKGWPEWYKAPEIAEAGTINSCKGIQDYLSIGMTVPLWCDVEVSPLGMDDMTARTSDAAFEIQRFDKRMTRGCPIAKGRERPNAGWPKIVSPWLYKTAPGYSMLALPIAYEPDPRYQVLPAVIHTDYYHNLHVVIRAMVEDNFTITAGTPIYQLFPFKRKDKLHTIIMGDAAMHRDGQTRGMNYGSIAKFSVKGAYRKHQRKADAD